VAQKLYIGNIPVEITDESLRPLLRKYDLHWVTIVADPETQQSRGIALAEVEHAQAAVSDINGEEYEGQRLHVVAIPETQSGRDVVYGRRVHRAHEKPGAPLRQPDEPDLE
jgi:RNA recognition motif-containing protein